MFEKFKENCKKHANKIVAACSGGAVMASGAISAFAAEPTADEAVQAAKTLMNNVTSTLNITNIVAIIGAGLGYVALLWLAWWGARKLVRMSTSAVGKGKIAL